MERFLSDYEAWLNGGRGLNRDMEPRLSETYRQAWEAGDITHLDAVLRFILLTREREGIDLIIQGLRSEERLLARAAAAVASTLLDYGMDLGPTIREDFERFAERFPDSETFTWAAVRTLDRRSAAEDIQTARDE